MALETMLTVNLSHLQLTLDAFDAYFHLHLTITVFHCGLLSEL